MPVAATRASMQSPSSWRNVVNQFPGWLYRNIGWISFIGAGDELVSSWHDGKRKVNVWEDASQYTVVLLCRYQCHHRESIVMKTQAQIHSRECYVKHIHLTTCSALFYVSADMFATSPRKLFVLGQWQVKCSLGIRAINYKPSGKRTCYSLTCVTVGSQIIESLWAKSECL